jgi:dTDP-D-glucose 4,6-dehydratase
MRVMVTGGAGFIGSAVCRHFILDLGHEVVVVDKITYAGNLTSLTPVASSKHFAFEKLDICDANGVNAIFSKYRPAAVIHLAAESHVDRSISGSNVFVQTNVVGTFTLLEAAREYLETNKDARKGFRFIHVSTDEADLSAKSERSARQHHTIQARPIRRQRLHPITLPKPGTALTVFRSSSRIARTIMGLISSPKSSFH